MTITAPYVPPVPHTQTLCSIGFDKDPRRHGVDISGPDEIGQPVRIQCKRYKPALKLNDVTDEIGKAEKLKGRLTALIIATTAGRDAKLQELD